MTRSSNVNSPTQDRIAMGLMLLAALGAAYAFITSIGVAASADPETQQVEWWRVLGFAMFTSIFVLLAFWPRRYPFLWELVILNKAALTLVEVILIGNNALNAASTAAADAVVTIILIAAYLLSKGYTSWRSS